jgi:hypothetical protein
MSVRLSSFAIALVIVANAVVLAGVAWNRLGEPAAVIELTERELAVPYGRWGNRENTGVSLSIRRTGRAPDWLDRDKLAELGFDVDRYVGGDRHRRRSIERRAHVALAYDGPAFQALLAEHERKLERAREDFESGQVDRRRVEALEAELQRDTTARSRLVAVDAAVDAETLRKRYGDSEHHVVMRALLRMRAVTTPERSGASEVQGSISRLLPGRVHVPLRFHDALDRATSGRRRPGVGEPPRYRVTLAFGRSGEPWVTGVEVMPAARQSD